MAHEQIAQFLEAIVRISVVITNFNYGDRVGAAIDSALDGGSRA